MPIAIGLTQPQILGSVSVGFLLNDALASQLKAITGSDIAFAVGGDVLTTTLPREYDHALAARLHGSGVSTVTLGPDEYLALALPLGSAQPGSSAAPVALILRSRTDQLRSLDAIHTGLAVTAVVAVLLATLLSFAVARTITRPLAAITDVMHEVAATGDLTRKIAVGEGRRWHDEDAQLHGDDVQYADGFDRALPARDVAEGAVVVARPAVHRHRARGAEPADDHQGIAARAAPAGRQPGGHARGGRRHRRGGRAAEPHRRTKSSTSRGRSASRSRRRT